MRTQVVPICASAKGSSASAMRRERTHPHQPGARACRIRRIRRGLPRARRAALGPEDEHQDQHHEGEHVLVFRAEQDEVAAALASRERQAAGKGR